MDKIRVGLPRGLTYYYFNDIWKSFFKQLDIDVVESPPTNKDIINRGANLATDEMCLSLKIYIGHVDYLKDKCDYVLIPRIDNYGTMNQTCTNFLAAYDIINNLFDINIIDYDINLNKGLDELSGFFRIGKILKKSRVEVIRAYNNALLEAENKRKKQIKENYLNLDKKSLKVLLVSHTYNTYDDYVGVPVINYLKELGVEIIYSDRFDKKQTEKNAYKLSDTIYFKYCKESIGSIKIAESKVDGIIFLSTFPCGLDSLVNELVLRKINKPYLNLIIDDMDSLTGIKTRLESFVDILEQRKQKN